MNTYPAYEEKHIYESPEIDIILLDKDVITLSHFDPNMGEWDTNI